MSSAIRAIARALTAFATLVVPPPVLSYTVDTTFTSPANVTGLWWIPSESGWGAALTQQGSIIFVTIFTYDSANNPTWYVASRCEISGDRCTDALFRVRGGAPLTVPFNSANVAPTSVGTVTLVFNDVNNGLMTFSIDGVTGSKQITRQVWGQPSPPPGGSLPAAAYSDVFHAWQQLAPQGGRFIRTVSVRNTPSSGKGCIYYNDSPKDRETVESLVNSNGGTITVSSATEFCARIGNDSICVRLFGGIALVLEEISGGILFKDAFMPGLAGNKVTTVRYAGDERFARVGVEWPDSAVGPGSSNCPAQPAQSKGMIDGNWSGYSFSYSPASSVASLAPGSMSCSNQTCTIPGPAGATFALSSTALWRTATGASRLAGAAVSDDSTLASVFLCRGATVVETQPFENCTFFSFRRQ